MSSTAARIAVGEIVSTTAAALARRSFTAMLLGQFGRQRLRSLSWSRSSGSPGGSGPIAGTTTRIVQAPRSASLVKMPLRHRASTEKPSNPGEAISYQGRVLDAEGRPFAGAALSLMSLGLKAPVSLASPRDQRA